MYDNIGSKYHASGTPIGHQIRRLRKARGWSLAALAESAGTSAPSLHRYENGWDRFEVATLRKIARALDSHLEITLVPAIGSEVPSPVGKKALLKLISPLFWDRDLEPDHLRKYPTWVIGRVLMHGNMAQARAVRRFYGDEAIRSAMKSRSIDDRTRTYWSGILGKEAHAP